MAHTSSRHARNKKRRPATSGAAVPHTAALPAPANDKAWPLGALMLAASVGAWAQTPAAPAAKTLGTVTVTDTAEQQQGKDALQTKTTNIGKGTQAIRDIPQSINVITEKLLDDAKLDTLKEALKYSSGISFQATENGSDQDIRLRGFPVATTGDLLIDGMRDPSQYERDTFNLDRIEVVRGAASMIFGRGSTGGVVNQVSKQPLAFDQYEIEGTVGSRGFFRTTADLNKKLTDDSAFRLNLMVTKADNDGAKIDKYGIAPTYRWGIGLKDEFSVGLYYLDNDNVPRNSTGYLQGSVPSRLDAANFYGMRTDQMDGRAKYIHGSWIHRLDDGGQIKTQARAGTFNRYQYSTIARFAAGTTNANLNDNTVVTRGGVNPRKDEYNGQYVQSDYTNKFNWFGKTNEITAGVDLAHESADREGNNPLAGTAGTRPNTTVGNHGAQSLGGTGRVPGTRPTGEYSGQSMGIYAQDLIQIAEDWKLLGGLRWDRFDARVGTFAYNGAGVATLTQNDITYNSLWSYRFGALYQPTPTSSYHVSYGTSFNTAVDSYQFGTGITNGVSIAQAKNTPAEKSRNIELGAKLDWLDGRLSTRGAIFRTEKYNERTTDIDNVANSFTLSGKRHSQGIELDVTGRLTSQWEIYASYTWIPNAKIDKAGQNTAAALALAGQSVGLTPKQSGSVWMSYQATPQLRVAGGVRAVGVNYPIQGATGAAATNARAPGYAVADAMVEYQIQEGLIAQLNVTNIGDRTYGDQLYTGFSMLGEPRTVKLTVTKRF